MIHSNPKAVASPWWGAAWKIIAFAAYALINTLTRYLSGGPGTLLLGSALPVNVIIFFQDSFALLFLLPWIIHQKDHLRHPSSISLHLARVIFSVSAIISWSFALFFIPQAEATALSLLGPVLGVMGAKWMLKERIGLHRLLFIIASFTISCCVAWHFMPDFKAIALWNWNYSVGLGCIILSAFLFAAAKVLTRKLANQGESPKKLTAYLLILIVPCSFLPALFVWVTPHLLHLPWLMLGGLLTVIAIYSVSKALSYAEISFLAPFDFIQFILNTAMGYWMFTEMPSTWIMAMIGALLMAHLGFLIFKRYRHLYL